MVDGMLKSNCYLTNQFFSYMHDCVSWHAFADTCDCKSMRLRYERTMLVEKTVLADMKMLVDRTVLVDTVR